MAGRLKGKIAVVTAAGQGIGRAIAEAFVREGATVWATDRDTDKLEGLARAKRRKLDVMSDRAVNAFAEKVGTIDSGRAIAVIRVARQSFRNTSTTSTASSEPSISEPIAER